MFDFFKRHIYSVVEYPVFSRIYTEPSSVFVNGSTFVFVDIQKPGSHVYIALLQLVVVADAETHIHVNSDSGEILYQMENGAAADTQMVIPVCQLFRNRIFLTTEDTENDCDFVAYYQLIYNNKSDFEQIRSRHDHY